MAPPELVDDVMRLVAEASLHDDDDMERQAHFHQLRLVSKVVKDQAHLSYPDGVSLLANNVVRRLLLERTTPSTFAATLQLAKPFLGEARELRLVYQNGDIEEPEQDPVWCLCAALILGEARRLERLYLNCWGAIVNLRQLDLERLSSLETLEIRSGWRDQLCPLDLSGMVSLRSFSMTTRGYSSALQPFALRLPRHLATLELSNIGLTTQDMLHPDLSSFSELQELAVYDDDLELGDATALQLHRLPRLRRLTLYGPWVATTFEEIRQCKALEEVDLYGNRLTSVAGLQLAGNSTITSLTLSNCGLSDPSELGLATNRSLVTLDVSENVFSSFLFGLNTNTTLRNLNLRGWYSGDGFDAIPPAHIRQLSAQLERNTTIERLVLCASRFNDTACRELRLEKTSGLKELDIRHNKGLGDEGVMPLLESIEQHGLKVCVHLEYTKVSEEVLERFRRVAS